MADGHEAGQWNNGELDASASSPSQWPTVDGPLGLEKDEAAKLARAFFYGGFALLPWLWFANCFYFWPVLRHRHSDENIRPYVVNSGIGFVIFTAVLLSWALAFAVGGERLFGPAWKHLALYDIADRLSVS